MAVTEAALAASATTAEVIYYCILGGVTLYTASYASKKAAKHLKEISEINMLHLQYLGSIKVNGKETPPLPKVFTGDKDPHGLEIGDDVLKDLAEAQAKYRDPRLPRYLEHILDAMTELRLFYWMRLEDRVGGLGFKGDRDDITSNVLCYLLLMISTHCVNIVDNDVALLYLDGFKKFVIWLGAQHNKFHNKSNSDYADHMETVRASLERAYYCLKSCSLDRSFPDLLSSLTSDCRYLVQRMLRYSTQLITPTKYWDYLDYCTPRKLADKQIMKHYPHSHTLLSTYIPLPDCPMGNAINLCAQDYLLSITMEDKTEEKGDFIKADRFNFKNLSKKDRNKVKEVFKNCKNFLTTMPKLDKYKESTNITVADHEEVLTGRINIFSDYLTLIDRINIANYFCSHLIKRADQLGEIYINNPHHCVFLFQVLQGLGTEIDKRALGVRSQLDLLKTEKVGAKLKAPDRELLNNIYNSVENIHSKCTDSVKYLLESHKESLAKSRGDLKRLVDLNQDVTLVLAHIIAKELHLETSNSKLIAEISAANAIKNPEEKAANLAELVPMIAAIPAAALAPPANQPVAVLAQPAVLDVEEKKSEEKHEEVIGLVAVDNSSFKLAEVHMCLEKIKGQQPLDPKFHIYLQCFLLLSKENLHAISFSEIRDEKAMKIQRLVFVLGDKLLNFLNQNAGERLESAERFLQLIESNLLNTDYLDTHENYVKGKLGFFATKSRGIIRQFEEACGELAESKQIAVR
jgi:hypothetical protein